MKRFNLILFFSLIGVFLIGFPSHAEDGNTDQTIGLDAEYHTIEEIRQYYKEHPVTRKDAEFEITPSSKAPYSLGKVSDNTLEDALNLVNMYRYIAGVNTVEISEEQQEYAQAAALLCASKGRVSHTHEQPDDMDNELYEKGLYGCGMSNLGGTPGVENFNNLIKRFLFEANGDTRSYGHRRALFKEFNKIGFGTAPSTSGTGCYSSICFDKMTYERKIIAYPGQNQPLEFYGLAYDWSVVIPYKVSTDNLKIKLTNLNSGRAWEFPNGEIGAYATYSSGATFIIFEPDNIYYRDGDKYRVEITGISTPISYEVNMFYLEESIHVEEIYTSWHETSVFVDPEATKRKNNNYYELKAHIYPENATNKNVIWTSSDESIAYPEWHGTMDCWIRALKPGKVIFTAMSDDGGFTDTTEITVKPLAESIEMNDEYTVGVGQTVTLNDYKVLPEESEDTIHLVYDSIDENIISSIYDSTDKIYKIKGIKEGTTKIKVYCGSNNDVTKEITIHVSGPIYIERMEIVDIPDYILDGETAKLKVKFYPENATMKEVSWKTSDRFTATVDKNGVITTSSKAGLVTITATATDGSDISVSCELLHARKLDVPEQPEIIEKTATTITIQEKNNREYSLDKINWQKSNVFKDLLPETTYDIYAREVVNRIYFIPSEACEPVKVTTDPLIQSIKIENEETTINVGEYIDVSYTTSPENIDDGNVIIRADRVSATIEDKRITFSTNGQYIIKVISIDDSEVYDSFKVNVIGIHEKAEKPNLYEKTATTVTLYSGEMFSSYKYDFTLDGINWQESNIFESLNPDTEYTFYRRIRADAYNKAGEISDGLKVRTNPLPSKISFDKEVYIIDYGSEIYLKPVIEPDSVSIEDFNWTVERYGWHYCNIGNDGYFKPEDCGAYKVTISSKEDPSVSASCEVWAVERKAPPEGLNIIEITDTTIYVSWDYYCEYSLDKENWQDSGYFEGLTPNTEYTIYVRYKEFLPFNYESESNDGIIVKTLDSNNNPSNNKISNPSDQKTYTDTDGDKYYFSDIVDNKQIKKNDKVIDVKSQGKYRITKISKKNGIISGGTVTYIAPSNKNCIKAIVPKSIKIAGKIFKVTAIDKNAFKGCKNISKITIGENIIKIGANAFNGCRKLKTIIIKGSSIKSIGSNAFKGINGKAKVKVPKRKIKSYTKIIQKAKVPKTAKIIKM